MQQLPAVPPLPAAVFPLQLKEQQPLDTLSPKPKSRSFVAKRLQLTGVSVYAESELVRVSGFVSDRDVTLQTLSGMADKITQRYRQDGYLVALAYVPAQTITDGTVTMAVIEGQYGQLKVNNTSTLDPEVPRGLLSGLNAGDVIATAPLEERLLLLSDVPGVQVRSTLIPGASVGLSDLIVDVQPGAGISGSIDADNAGSRYTGENRLGVTLNLNNPSGAGDLVTLRGLTSGTGLQYARAAYQAPVGRGRLGVAYSDLSYALGREFQDSDTNGYAHIASLFGSYPLVRSRDTKMNVGLSLDSKVMQDRSNARTLVTDKRAQVATASLYGDHRDTWIAGGLSSYSLALSSGDIRSQSTPPSNSDANAANSNGSYQKIAYSVSRLQQTAIPSFSLFASMSGQLASKNLDVSEKMELGGMYGVRAYPEGEAYADEGYLLTLEARQLLPVDITGQLQVAAFVDAGAVTLSHSPSTPNNNTRHLSGAGVGLNWMHSNNFLIRMFYARKLGDGVTLSAPDKSGRFWVQAVSYF